MPEQKLTTKSGPDLYRQLLGDLPAATGPEPSLARPLARRPRCHYCKDLDLPPDLLAGPNDTWVCGRGHGVIG